MRNHLALNKLPQELAEQIADGHLPMGTGIAVASIKNEHKRNGLALFVLSNPPEQLTAKAVKDVAKKLASWGGLQVPLTCAHQAQRNIARSLTRLWHLVVDVYPVRSWAVISSFIYQDVDIQAPWEDASAVDLWFKTIGGEHYYGEDGIKWESVVTNLMDEVSCSTCPVAKLPARQLRSDLSPGRSDVLGMPCRSDSQGPCLHGLAPNDPFHVRVPWDWAEHEGVEKDASGYVALSFDNLQTAWQAQATLEGEDDSSDVLLSSVSVPDANVVLETNVEAVSVTQANVEAVSVTQANVEAVREPQANVEAVSVSENNYEAVNVTQANVEAVNVTQANVEAVREPQANVEVAREPQANVEVASVSENNYEAVRGPQANVEVASVPLPVKKMRQLIATYMQQHTTMNVDHPFATPCAKCQHKLSASPTKDSSVPHCAWAGRWRQLHFSKLNPTAGKMIPVCRQFAPKERWAQLIPAHPQKAIMSREWIKHQIQVAVNRSPKKDRQLFEFLTGRPMNHHEDYKHWFIEQLAEEEHALSDEQMWTLLVWVLAESARGEIWSMSKWQKLDDSRFMIPADEKNSYFIKVSEVEFIAS